MTEGPSPETPEEERRVDRLLEPLFSDPMLQPMLLAFTAISVMMGATVLLLAVAARRVSAMAALAILLVMSAEAVRADLRQRRLGRTSKLIIAVWGLSVLGAVAAVWSGLY